MADLVMEVIEETAITTALHPPKWWFRYVDDSHACRKKDQVDAFHQHLNSVNANSQFTLQLENTNRYGLPFLDTIMSRRGTALQVNVYRKPTHTDRYLDFLSPHPSCHKRSVVNTLLLRAKDIPSTLLPDISLKDDIVFCIITEENVVCGGWPRKRSICPSSVDRRIQQYAIYSRIDKITS